MKSSLAPDLSPAQQHIPGCAEDIGRYVLLPGDPERVEMIASFLDSCKKVGSKGACNLYSGSLAGTRVSVMSTGIGGPPMAIAVKELSSLGADTFIRVGTSGLLQPYLRSGDLVVVTGAVRDEGTGCNFLPLAFPAASSLDVVESLRAGCEQLNQRHWVGIVHSKDSLYGEWEPDRMPAASLLKDTMQAWIKAGVLCSEMEMAALLIVAGVLGKRAGGLIISLSDDHSLAGLCQAAVLGLKLLIINDQKGNSIYGYHQ